MGIKAFVSSVLSKIVSGRTISESLNANYQQWITLGDILLRAKDTQYGRTHHFSNIRNYSDYRDAVKINDYEGFKPYIDKISKGERCVLWPGMPLYFAKTSGTTSGIKYIPITKESINNHINGARNALLMYIYKTGNAAFTDHKMIFLQGSPILEKHGVVNSGRLSGIVAHHVPFYLQKNRLPSWETNTIDDWETKVNRIVDETIDQRMSLISGIPSWLRMYFEILVKRSGKTVGDLFPDLSLIVYGGVNFEPYKPVFSELLGRSVDTLQLFPASEGFFAYQDEFPSDDMLLNTNSGIFYEFVPVDKISDPEKARIPLEDVKTGINYAMILTSNAGLYSYSIGDSVAFTSLQPYRIKVTGRTAHYISAFGEHVIGSEVEGALAAALAKSDARVSEFTVAPFIEQRSKPYHEWLVEFEKLPTSLDDFSKILDNEMRRQNIYYDDLIRGNVLDKLKITVVESGIFNLYMKSKGMLGGQNKLPRLSNDRKIAEAIKELSFLPL